ncbi:uncharacterized protein LOC110716023 [Chenopodium quinoa]|uniref:uncharacterized protein LOC110716023 n=1 Tax=Chenopodium quinoa TaxID=63459 RepID=UPI000B785F5D|nr:uncharacterized protein LOC110716023 [Chenopodium quinoa]
MRYPKIPLFLKGLLIEPQMSDIRHVLRKQRKVVRVTIVERRWPPQKKQADKHCGTPSNTQAPQGFVFPYNPQSVGGIQMVDGDGSIGYFIGVSGGHTVPANFSGSETELQSMYRAGFIPYQYTQYRPMYPYGVLAATSHSPPTPRSASSLTGGRPMFRPIALKPPMSTYGCNQQAPTQHQSNHFVQQFTNQQ